MGAALGGLWMLMIPKDFYVLQGAKRIREIANSNDANRQARWTQVFNNNSPETARAWLIAVGERDNSYGIAVMIAAMAAAFVLLSISVMICR